MDLMIDQTEFSNDAHIDYEFTSPNALCDDIVKDNSDMIKQLKNMKKKLEKNFVKQ